MDVIVKPEVFEVTEMCADRGWKATFYFKSGQVASRVFITGADWDKKFVSVERVGERNKPAQLIDLREVEKVDPHWG